jgi:hypothetical protein
VLQYDGSTGACQDLASGGLRVPPAWCSGPTATFVGDALFNTVLQYNGSTTAFVKTSPAAA